MQPTGSTRQVPIIGGPESEDHLIPPLEAVRESPGHAKLQCRKSQKRQHRFDIYAALIWFPCMAAGDTISRRVPQYLDVTQRGMIFTSGAADSHGHDVSTFETCILVKHRQFDNSPKWVVLSTERCGILGFLRSEEVVVSVPTSSRRGAPSQRAKFEIVPQCRACTPTTACASFCLPRSYAGHSPSAPAVLPLRYGVHVGLMSWGGLGSPGCAHAVVLGTVGFVLLGR